VSARTWDPNRRSYLHKVFALDLTPGTVNAIDVLHDPSCPLLAGEPSCNCDPTLQRCSGAPHCLHCYDSGTVQ
jgi:hypothetical protein